MKWSGLGGSDPSLEGVDRYLMRDCVLHEFMAASVVVDLHGTPAPTWSLMHVSQSAVAAMNS